MKVIGIVGGVASGKSLVTKQLSDLGAVVLDADRIGHDVLREEDVKRSIRLHFGDSVFDGQGEVDRRKLGEIVFDPDRPDALQVLELISHPLIEKRLVEQIEQLRRSPKGQDGDLVVVLDAAIMVRTGWYRLCDEIIFVDASSENRIVRARQRGWTESQLGQREARQATIREKQSVSTRRIDNNGSIAETRDQVNRLWTAILECPS